MIIYKYKQQTQLTKERREVESYDNKFKIKKHVFAEK